jgi:ribosomal protein S10
MPTAAAKPHPRLRAERALPTALAAILTAERQRLDHRGPQPLPPRAHKLTAQVTSTVERAVTLFATYERRSRSRTLELLVTLALVQLAPQRRAWRRGIRPWSLIDPINAAVAPSRRPRPPGRTARRSGRSRRR